MSRMLNFFTPVFFSLSSITIQAYDIPASKRPSIASNDNVEFLQKMSRGVSTISEHARKGIVFVSIEKVAENPLGRPGSPLEFFFGPGFRGPGGQGRAPEQKQKGLGSGFFVDLDKGYVITNNHVVEGADKIHLKLANGKEYEGKVVGSDKQTDVAVVKIEGSWDRKGIIALSLGESEEVTVGDLCIAAGAPFGLEASISFGTVSAIGRGNLSITELGNFIQTDAAINPGNSGGPLLSMQGQVIGMNTAIFSKSGAYNGIGFAIPASLVRNVAGQLINNGKIQRGYLGVELSDLDSALSEELGLKKGEDGVLIRSVGPDTPAEKGGVEAGDVVVALDGVLVRGLQSLRSRIGLKKPKTRVELTVVRNKKKQKLTVSLGNFPSQESFAKETGKNPSSGYGVSTKDPSNSDKRNFALRSKRGAFISKVTDGSPAGLAGLERGDLIVKVNGKTIKSNKDFNRTIKGTKRLLLRVERRGRFLFVVVSK